MYLTIGCLECAGELEQLAGAPSDTPKLLRAVLVCNLCGAQQHLVATLQPVRPPSARRDRRHRQAVAQ